MSQLVLPNFHSVRGTREAPSDHLSSWQGYCAGEIGVDSANRPHICVRIFEAVDVDALERAVSAVIDRHDVLKAKITERAGRPWVTRVPRMKLHVERIDLGRVRDREARAREILTELVWTPLDLRKGPLFRAVLVRLGAKDDILLLILHHFIGDAVSTAILYREIRFAYACLKLGQEPAFTPLPLQYADYLTALHAWYDSPSAKPHFDYWRTRFSDYPGLAPIDTDALKKNIRTKVSLGTTLKGLIPDVSHSEKVSAFTVLLAAQNALLAHLTHTGDIVIAAVTDGRDLPALRGVVGYLADRTYYRTDLSGNPSFREILRRVQANVQEASRHPMVRFDKFQHVVGHMISAPVFNFRAPGIRRSAMADGWTPFKLGPAPSVTRPGYSVCAYWLELAQHPTGFSGSLRPKDGIIPGFMGKLKTILLNGASRPATKLRDLLET